MKIYCVLFGDDAITMKEMNGEKNRRIIMKHVVSIVVVMLAILKINCSYPLIRYTNYQELRPIIVSDKIGEEMDIEECTRFHLFSGVIDFRYATFYEIEGGGYEVKITTAFKTLVAVNRDSMGIMILRDYIDNYNESTAEYEKFNHKWKIIDYDIIGLPITAYEVNNVRRTSYTCCCALGSSFATLLPNFLISFCYIGGGGIFEGHQVDHPFAAFVSFILINTVIAVPSAIIGGRIDNHIALNMIKRARVPRELN